MIRTDPTTCRTALGDAIRFAAGLLLIMAGPSAARPQPQDGPKDQFGIAVVDDEIVVSGIDVDTTVALLGIIHRTEDFHASLERVDVLLEGDPGGEGRYTYAHGEVPSTSLWFAVNLDTRAIAMAPGDPEFDPGRLALPRRTVDGFGATTALRFEDRSSAELLLIRFGTGSWVLTANDGGSGEEESDPDGDLTISADSFTDPEASRAPPQSLAATDLLLAIDRRNFDWAVTEVGPLAAVGQ